MDFANYFQGKKVTVMGLGLLGRGVGDAAYLAEQGAEVVVTDLKTEAELQDSVEQLRQYENITFVLGEHRDVDFTNGDLVLVAAGVPYDSPYLDAARAAGVPLRQSAALFAQLSGIPIIGVTGTRGKSTVAHLIHHVLTQVTGEHIILGGNIRGVSNLQLLKEVRKDSLAVMELDSWQLQGFGWAEISPQIAVFTNFMEDHLNYYLRNGRTYEEAMDAYFADKANIFRYQEESGVLITTPEVFERAQKSVNTTIGQEVVLADASVIPEDAHLAIQGEHNRLNAALAYEALKATSLEDEEIFAAMATFPGVPGRLEYLTEIDGVKIFNDNNSTDPKATAVGIQTLGNTDAKRLVLIAGGADKQLDPQPMLEAIKQYCKAVVWLPGTGTDRVSGEVDDDVVANTEAAVSAALNTAESGDVILFSPGFASFGLFKNEYDRNDQFVAAIRAAEAGADSSSIN